MDSRQLIFGSAVIIAAGGAASAGQYGPAAYARLTDSPLLTIANSLYIETFEDGASNTFGLEISPGLVLGPTQWTDSVDGDDGVMDGSGTGGHSLLVYNGLTGIDLNFSPVFNGQYPNIVGFVWTDGNNPIMVQAFDRNGIMVETNQGDHADVTFQGTADEDRYYGFSSVTGISRVHIFSLAGGGIEIDHVQFGMLPSPGALALLGAGGLLMYRRRR